MKIILSLLTFAGITLSTFIIHAQDSRDQLPASKAEIAKQDRLDRPRAILIKKDQNGEIFIHKSDQVIGKVDENSAANLDKLQFQKLSDFKGKLDIENIASVTDELDRDLPRQSWYWWGYGYGYGYSYYYPVYYYSYAYYPYYYYGWGGCSYYWYRW